MIPGEIFPAEGEIVLNEGRDPVKLSEKHYKSMGMKVDDIIARSDLYEKEGKSPHAFCTNIDRGQDIRVLCNVKPNANWMDTMHHELGHGVYDEYIGKDVPFLLHEPAHILTTEGMAMMFGALTKNPEFMGAELYAVYDGELTYKLYKNGENAPFAQHTVKKKDIRRDTRDEARTRTRTELCEDSFTEIHQEFEKLR